MTAATSFARMLGVEGVALTVCHVGKDGAAVALPPHDGEIEVVVRQGNVVDGLIDVADRSDADLIVMTTRGIDGSVMEQVVRRAPCPVLAVPLVTP